MGSEMCIRDRSFLEWKEGENSENKYLELEKFDEFSNVSEK